MSDLSLRRHLAQIGEPKSTASLRIPTDFHVIPPSGRLRDIMKATRSPQPEQWTKTAEKLFENEGWTEECQGVTHDESYWYLSSNAGKSSSTGRQRVYRFSLANDVVDHVKLSGNGSDHLGDIDYYKGHIYCGMDDPVQIVVIDTPPFTGWWAAPLVGESSGPPPQTRVAWCAVNPWNGLLYSAQITKSIPGDTLYAYRLDPAGKRFVHVPAANIVLPEKLLFVQGAVFSKNGHVLLASHDTRDIRCYSVLNGHYLGRADIRLNNVEGEEVEGLTIWEDIKYDGAPTHVHVILLDNDIHNDDDVYFKHYQVPLSEDL
ncbi:hypothetical protein R1X32_02620 (plasmid) [Rhodococcus opacus]|uniref:Uncharacterized protein n=1 Tax=Rhodococcus opacus TaxID=37919 RepID=A0ABT4NLH6_RHOOP|nr:hypothetical protein [Rhodococcus opacus]MCZ4588220.1 hypothetical protein [Rhodococcus opacus]MDV7087617.1 hypothetical protein [Rhodococcus opacus]WKN61099.1 hypothetical protein HJ581_0046610 [Rhodococcus opacus]